MTNREWLNSLSDEDFVTWLTQDEELVLSEDGDRFVGVQPSPRFKTLKFQWTSIAAGLTHWLTEERMENKTDDYEEKRLLIDDILDGKYKSYEEYVADVGRGPDTFGRAEFQFLAALVDAVEKIEEEKERKG